MSPTKTGPKLEAQPSPFRTSIVQHGLGDQGDLVRIALVGEGPLVLLNAHQSMHFRTEIRHRNEWKDLFRQLSDGCPQLAWADLTIWHEVGRRVIPDLSACAITAKWAIDGCRDYTDESKISPTYGQRFTRIFPDDTPEFIRRHTYEPPMFTARDALTLEFIGPLAPNSP